MLGGSFFGGADGDSAPANAPAGDRALRGTEKAVGPPTRQELGHSTWTFLHKLAAKYPIDPTVQEQADMRTFFYVFSQRYPCDECAGHFRSMLEKYPPDTRSNTAMQAWLCMLHNNVNRRLGHSEFECTEEALTARWGGCGCEDGDAT